MLLRHVSGDISTDHDSTGRGNMLGVEHSKATEIAIGVK